MVYLDNTYQVTVFKNLPVTIKVVKVEFSVGHRRLAKHYYCKVLYYIFVNKVFVEKVHLVDCKRARDYLEILQSYSQGCEFIPL